MRYYIFIMFFSDISTHNFSCNEDIKNYILNGMRSKSFTLSKMMDRLDVLKNKDKELNEQYNKDMTAFKNKYGKVLVDLEKEYNSLYIPNPIWRALSKTKKAEIRQRQKEISNEILHINNLKPQTKPYITPSEFHNLNYTISKIYDIIHTIFHEGRFDDIYDNTDDNNDIINLLRVLKFTVVVTPYNNHDYDYDYDSSDDDCDDEIYSGKMIVNQVVKRIRKIDHSNKMVNVSVIC